MGDTYESYELTPFNLEGHIDLKGKCGLLKLFPSEDGKIVLVDDVSFSTINQVEPTPSRCGNVCALLGFVLDIGIRRERLLALQDGFYFGQPLINPQSTKLIEQAQYDPELMERFDSTIQSFFRSGDSIKEAEAVRLSHLLESYNDARLLYPNFLNESYLT